MKLYIYIYINQPQKDIKSKTNGNKKNEHQN
jgi:hypothetical protein